MHLMLIQKELFIKNFVLNCENKIEYYKKKLLDNITRHVQEVSTSGFNC